MSRSNRDRKAYIARNCEKVFAEEMKVEHSSGDILFERGIYPTKNYPKIAWSIMGKRRRNTSRKSNQRFKPMMRKIQRARYKSETIKIIKDDSFESGL